MEIIIPLIIGVLIYLIMMWATRKTIDDDLYKLSEADRREYPHIVEKYFLDLREEFMTIWSLLWPLYHFYRIGVLTGRKVYHKIVKSDEDRFATWFF